MLENTKMSRRTFLGATGSAAAMLGLAACGGGSGASSDSGSGDAAAAGGTTGGATLTVGSAYQPSSFDPNNCSSAFCLSANMNVVEGLYDIDFHDYSTSDGLCVGDPVWVDDNTAEITLREGAAFSTGDPVTPEDVVEAFKRCNAEGGMYISFLTAIDSIEKKTTPV